jgi:single-strand DNA-binding protein
MAGSVNQVMLIGRLGKAPEMRFTSQGTAVTTFNLATNRPTRSADTDWHKIVCFKDLAERVNQHLDKGRLVCVIGSLQYNTYENKDGVKVTQAQILANNITYLDSGKKVSEKDNEKQTKQDDDFE